VIPYIIAQVAGAIVAAAVLYAIASGKPDWVAGGFASNGFGDLSPGKYGLMSCFFSEVIATFFFLYVIIGTTSKGAAVGFAGIPIGLCLTLIHLFLIPVTNASVNPARSTSWRMQPSRPPGSRHSRVWAYGLQWCGKINVHIHGDPTGAALALKMRPLIGGSRRRAGAPDDTD
jgi:glycerol uptake facilitator-like aquaporin